MKKLEGGWALAVCALGWSLAGVFLKYVNINSFAIAGLRSFFAFITIVAFSKRFPRLVIRTGGSNEDFNSNVSVNSNGDNNSNVSANSDIGYSNNAPKIDRKRTFYLWMAAVSYALTMILFCLSNKLTYSANAVILQYTNPAWIILLGPFLLGEKNRKVDYLAIGGVIIGMFLFFADTIFGKPNGEFAKTATLGNILALASGVTFAFTTIFQRKQQMVNSGNSQVEGNTSQDSFMIAQIIVTLFGLPFVFFTKNGFPDMQSLIFLILLGVFQMGIPNITYAIGIKKVKAFSASLITMLEPLMNPIWVMIFVGEIPSWYCALGGIIILGVILLREIVGSKKN